MADWAYDEDPSGRSLKELLHEQNYTLVKHDQTTLPGYLGHYVAIPTNDDTDESMKKTLPISSFPSTRQDQRRAVIGVKGTSGLEDFLTDLCGASVELDVDTTEWRRKMRMQALPPEAKSDGGGVVIRAHEGVAIASRRLADDLKPIITNLLLPQNYKLTIVGHSLGAAGASLLAVMLLAEISELEPSQLEVFAFASPPTLDLVTARAVEPFTTTIINNNDVIPRMNVAPVEATVGMLKAVDDMRRRRDDELQAMAQTYRQQHRWWYQRWKNRSQFIDRKRAVVSAPLMMDTEFLEVLKTVTNNKAPATDDSVDDNPNHLYVPGKVVLMYKSWSNVTTAQIESLTTTSPNDKTDSSSLTPINIIMSNIDGTHDTITTTTANLVQTVTTTTSDDVAPVTGIPPTAADRVVICNATSPPIRTLELDARMVDDHMTTGYRQSLQSVLSKEASP
jgi:pimeloyl-ACP methyl ester carboxylesterase